MLSDLYLPTLYVVPCKFRIHDFPHPDWHFCKRFGSDIVACHDIILNLIYCIMQFKSFNRRRWPECLIIVTPRLAE